MSKIKKKRPNRKRIRLVGEKVSNGNEKLDKIIGFLFILGLSLLVWEIFIYRKTIIDLKIPLLIWLLPGIIMTPLLYDKMNNIDGMKAHWTLHYLLHTGMTGAFILFLFMATNFYLADSSLVKKQFEIIEKGSLPGSKGHRNERKPYVVINYEGLEKELIFSYSQIEKVNDSRYANLYVKKGLWGFDILEEYKVE